jgi:RNA ligase
MIINLEQLNLYIEAGLIVKQSHPDLPLSIYNYSRKCQYENIWDDITMSARGLIAEDISGRLVARGFDKFFNYDQLPSVGMETPNESFEVFDKADGSYISAFFYNGKWMAASKGSFTSDHAIKANALLSNMNTDALSAENSYCFELVGGNSFRIVCDYGEESRLILLSAFNLSDGSEVRFDVLSELSLYGYELIKRFDGVKDFREVTKMFDGDNREGFVIRFESGLRVKLKYDEYLRLHRIVTNITSYDIWEMLCDGSDITELLDRVPDEFDVWVKTTVSDLLYNYNEIDCRVITLFSTFETLPDKKKYAEWVFSITKDSPKLAAVLFKLYEGREYSHLIWKMIKPEFAKAFKVDAV